MPESIFIRLLAVKDLVVLLILALLFSGLVLLRSLITDFLALHLGDAQTAWFVVGVGLWLLGGLLVDAAVKRIFFRRLIPHLTGNEAPHLLVSLSTAVIMIVAIGGGLVVTVEGTLSTFLTTSGALTVVVGFALRELILDFFCGIAINLEQPFKMGDWVEVQRDLVAKVVEINWRATRLQTDSHKVVVVPNRTMASANLINYSLPTPVYRENMKLVLGNEHDPDRIANILMSAVLSTPQVLADRKNRVRIDGFNERGTIWALKFWIASYSDRIPAVHTVYANCIRFLHAAGIEIPCQRNEVVMSQGTLSSVLDVTRSRSVYTILRRVPLFERLHNDEVQTIAGQLQEHSFKSGATIVKQGEQGQSLFVLAEGLLTVQVDGREVAMIQPGKVFGEMSLLTGDPRRATVTAKTEAVVLEIDAAEITQVMEQRPSIADELARIMVHNQRVQAAKQDDNAAEKAESQALAEKIRSFFKVFTRK